MTSKTYAQIVGWGKYVPGQILTNDDLAEMVDTSDDWIRTRTGIVERRIAELYCRGVTLAEGAPEWRARFRELLDRIRGAVPVGA